jgi:hypothetical protein
LLLPGIACAGENNCNDELENAVTKTTGNDKHEKEDCGNFCACSCCVHIVSVNFQSQMISIDKPFEETAKQAFYQNVSLPSNYFGNIWQPPKMS